MPPISKFHNPTVAVKTLQFVGAGLIGGLTIATIAFTYTALNVKVTNPVPAAIFFPYVGLGAAVLQTLASFFLKSWMLSPDRLSKLPPENWEMAAVGMLRTATIVCMALCEAGGFILLVMCLMGAMNGACPPIFFAGMLIPLGGMAKHFPTWMKWEQLKFEAERFKPAAPATQP